jgi:DNA-binding MarR family transcriptional regulator
MKAASVLLPSAARRWRRRGFDCLCGNVRMAARALTAHYDACLAPSGLTSNQLAVLWSVIAAEPVALGEIADYLVMDKTSVTRSMAGLAAMGLVVLRTGTDARVKLASSTAKGRRVFASAMPLWRQAQAEVRRTIGRGTFARTVREARRMAWTMARPRPD